MIFPKALCYSNDLPSLVVNFLEYPLYTLLATTGPISSSFPLKAMSSLEKNLPTPPGR